ncbi:MAG: hypothetical protein FWF86_02520 [Clostridia bacterium]|nr:hypothetical protein [Clostridia bacterium]
MTTGCMYYAMRIRQNCIPLPCIAAKYRQIRLDQPQRNFPDEAKHNLNMLNALTR